MVGAPTPILSLPFTTWFGMRGRVTAGTDGWHVAEVGRLHLRHPGLVNMLLRASGPPEETLRLVVLHERGHFETSPAAAVHLLFMLAVAFPGRPDPGVCRYAGPPRALLCGIALLAVSHQAAWEALAEAWVARHEGRSYCYAQGGVVRQALFWTVTLTLASAALFLRRSGGRKS